jgi:hypothetical protein
VEVPQQQPPRHHRKGPSPLKRKRGDRPYRLLGLSKAIIETLLDRFVARTTDLYRLVPQRAAKRSDHEREIRAALKRLREYAAPHEKTADADRTWGYIRSVSWSDPTIENKIEYTCLVHGLTDRGLKLARGRGLDPDHIGRTFQEFSSDHVDHELRLNDFADSLRSVLQEKRLELIVMRINLKRKHIHPDLLFYIYDPANDVRSAPIFLEYEKQKRGRYDDGKPQIIKKVESLVRYYDSPECERDFNFRKFYLMVILRTERKANFLLKDLCDRGINRHPVLVASEPAFKASLMYTRFRSAGGETYLLLDL